MCWKDIFQQLEREHLQEDQQAALESAHTTYQSWSAMSRRAIEDRRAGLPSASDVSEGRARKRVTDEIRGYFETMRRAESARGAQRAAAATRTTRITVGITVALTLLAGLLLGTFVRQEVGRLASSYHARVAELHAQTEELRNLTATLEQRVDERTRQWQQANQELEAFTYSVSHDLRAPLRHISGFSELLRNALAGGDIQARHYLDRILARTHEAGQLIDDLLAFSRTGRVELAKSTVDTMALVRTVIASEDPQRKVEWVVNPLPSVRADPGLLRIVFTNLLSNAVKYTRTREHPRVEISAASLPDRDVFTIADNGVGFDMRYADKLFGVFQRLHSAEEFEGTGIGLATVRRIVARHGGETWATAIIDGGATLSFSLPKVDA